MKCSALSRAHGNRRQGRTTLGKTGPVNTSSPDAVLREDPCRPDAVQSRQHVSARSPRSSGFLSATAERAAHIPEPPIGPRPGRALGGARALIGRRRSMKRPRRFLRGSAALVCGGARAAGLAGGQRAPPAGPGTCGTARARTPQDPLRDLSLPAPPAQLSRGTAGVGGRGPRGLRWLLHSGDSAPGPAGL